VSASLIDQGNCDVTAYAIFTDILQYLDWIADPMNDKPKCGVMSLSAGLVQGGSSSTSEQFPWIVSINRYSPDDRSFIAAGSGSLISTKHVLSEAYSVADVDQSTNKLNAVSNSFLKLFLGSLKNNEASDAGSIEVTGNDIDKIVIHPEALYEMPIIANLAIVSFKSSIQTSNFIFPVCLWSGSDDINAIVGKNVFGVGFSDDEKEGQRKHYPMTVRNQAYCERYWKGYLQNSTKSKYFCAKGNGMGGMCYGDSAVYIKVDSVWYIRGIANLMKVFATKTCDFKVPILNEDIAFYYKWIKRQIELQ